jgi:hypothetical protein
MAEHRSICIGSAMVIYTDVGCETRYDDGTAFGAHPHDTHHYHVIAHRLGYGDDILSYAREHEVCHHLVGETFFGGPSPVVWALAHGQQVDPSAAALEEAMVMAVQRWVRANERPIIGGVDWNALRYRALALTRSASRQTSGT